MQNKNILTFWPHIVCNAIAVWHQMQIVQFSIGPKCLTAKLQHIYSTGHKYEFFNSWVLGQFANWHRTVRVHEMNLTWKEQHTTSNFMKEYLKYLRLAYFEYVK